jgi:hypothetical protein
MFTEVNIPDVPVRQHIQNSIPLHCVEMFCFIFAVYVQLRLMFILLLFAVDYTTYFSLASYHQRHELCAERNCYYLSKLARVNYDRKVEQQIP